MKRITIAISLILASVAGAANVTFDTQTTGGDYVNAGYVDSRYYVGVRYTAPASKTLTQVDYNVNSITGDVSAKNYYVEVWSLTGDNLNAKLGSSDAHLGMSTGWNSFTFTTPVALTASTIYAIVATTNAVDGDNYVSFTTWTDYSANGYTAEWASDKSLSNTNHTMMYRYYEAGAESPASIAPIIAAFGDDNN